MFVVLSIASVVAAALLVWVVLAIGAAADVPDQYVNDVLAEAERIIERAFGDGDYG